MGKMHPDYAERKKEAFRTNHRHVGETACDRTECQTAL